MSAPNISTETAVSAVSDVLVAIFSWLFLAAIGLIVSGELMARRIPLGIQGDARFRIDMYLFRIEALKDAVYWGFMLFVPTLGLVIWLGGHSAYDFLKSHAGLDIGQWHSLCAISSCFSIVIATACWFAIPIMTSSPIISETHRSEQIRKLEERLDPRRGGK